MNELISKRKAVLEAARAICVKAEAEKRDLSEGEQNQINGYMAEAENLKGQIKRAQDQAALKSQLDSLLGDVAQPAPDQGQGNTKGRTLGEQFVNAEAWQAWYKNAAPGGVLPDGARGLQSPPVQAKGLLASVMGRMERKDLITGASDTSAGAFVQTDYSGLYEPLGRYPLTLRDLISRRTTGSDIIEFVRQTAKVQQAAPTAEANVKYPTGATGEVTGTKPQGSMAFEKVTTTVKTVAVYVGVTKRALADAAQIRGIIDQELRDDLAEELEDQCLNGNGVGENFTGLANTANVLAQAFNTDILTTTRQAITTLRTTGLTTPTAWMFNPADWETVELIQDLNGRYYHNGPLELGPARLWGYPVVQSQAKAAGTAFLGDWRKAVLWDRQTATISVTDSHDDWFIRNMVAILAELRAAFAVIRPSAFIEVDLA